MGKSFQEQLLNLGLVDKKKVNATKKEHHKNKKKKVRKNTPVIDENALLAQKAEEKKKARVKQLNQEREEKLKKRAEQARVKQLIAQHRLAKDPKGTAYRFNCKGKIQRIFVDKDLTEQLSAGKLAIAQINDQFEIIPRNIARKLREIDPHLFLYIVSNTEPENSSEPDDPYAEYKVPDDLMW